DHVRRDVRSPQFEGRHVALGGEDVLGADVEEMERARLELGEPRGVLGEDRREDLVDVRQLSARVLAEARVALESVARGRHVFLDHPGLGTVYLAPEVEYRWLGALLW